jgi:Txe/YoeB family toxin of Txe-Axe toxin-antitoxin module
MPEYIIKMYKAAEKDYEELKRAGQKDKVDDLLRLISNDPFITPPKYEELSGRYREIHFKDVKRRRDTNPYSEICRRLEPAHRTEHRLDSLEKLLKEILIRSAVTKMILER